MSISEDELRDLFDLPKETGKNPSTNPAPLPNQEKEARDTAMHLFGFDSIPERKEVPSGIVPFASSFISAATKEQIGMEPSEYTKEYRASSWGGTLSHLAGALTPVIATAGFLPPIGAIEAVPVLGRGLTAAKGFAAAGRPILASSIEGAYSLIPYDAARLAGSVVAEASGSEGAVRNVGREAAFDFALGGVIGAGAGLVRAIRPGASIYDKALGLEERIRKQVPEFDPGAIPQERFATLSKFKANPNMPDDLRAGLESDVAAALAKANEEIVGQLPGRYVRNGELNNGRYVLDLEGKTRNTAAARDLNKMWAAGPSKGLGRTSALLVGERYGLKSMEEVEGVLQHWAPPDGWQGAVQFPRLLVAEKGSSKAIREVLSNPNGLTKIDNGLWIGKETDGLYAVAQRLATKPGEEARYILFKTHNPNLFYPNLGKDPVEQIAMKITDQKLRAPETKESWAVQDLNRTLRQYPAEESVPKGELPRFQTWARANLPKGLNSVREDLTRIAGGALRPLKGVLTPVTHQFTASPKAVWLLNVARKQYDIALERAYTAFYGTKAPLKSKTLLGAIVERPEYTGGVEKAIHAVHDAGPEAWAQYNRAVLGAIPYDTLKQQGFHPAVLEAIRKQGRLSDTITRQQIVTDKATETAAEESLIPLENHRLVSRLYEGDFRAAVVTDKGHVVGYGAGRFASTARDEAKALAERSNALAVKEGRATRYSTETPFPSSKNKDRELVGRLIRDPQETQNFRKALIEEYGLRRFNERSGSIGYVGDIRPMTLQQAKDNVLGNLIDSHLHMAHQAVLYGLKSERVNLAKANPALAEQLEIRLTSLRGHQSPLNQKIEDAIDKPLAPIFGSKVASRIFGVTNQIQHALTLGFVDVGYPVVNVTSILTQMMPEINNIMHATPADLSKYFTYHLVKGPKGVYSMGVIDNAKYLREVFRDIINPSQELRDVVDMGLRQHHLNPKFVEEVAGSEVMDIRQALQDGDYVKFLWRLSLFPGAKSEELARMVGFVGAYKAAREFMGLETEKAYDLAIQMLRKSMYGYTTADRPRIITGPLGKGFGLFKNWGMSYIANMIDFAGKGLLHGNWKPFLWQMATGAAVGGIGATPVALIAEGLSRAFTDKGFMENTYDYFGAREDVEGVIGDTAATKVADVFYSGLPTLAGISLQNRASLPGSDPFRDITQLSNVMLFDRMGRFGAGVTKGLAYYEATGRNPVHDRETMDAFAMAMAPRSLQRMMAITEDGMIRSMRNGNALVGPMSFTERFLFFLGINPLDVAKGYEVADLYREDNDRKKEAISAAGEALAYANKRNDRAGAYDIMIRALLHELPVPSVIRSERVVSRNIGTSKLDQWNDYTMRRRKEIFGIR